MSEKRAGVDLVLVEKLLLHVLIILMPNFILNVFFENKRYRTSPYLIGVLNGIALSLCLIFSFFSFGLYWDLRYVPLVLATLYGGPVSGGIVFLFYLVTRTFLGGDALIYGYISGFLAFIVPFVFSRKFWSFQPKDRVKWSIRIGNWPNFVMLLILIIYCIFQNFSIKENFEVIGHLVLFGFIQVAAIWFASMLKEMYIERRLMKKEIHRAEKLKTLGELAASVAHEVRNPLTVVKGFLQIMQQQDKNGEHQFLPLVLSELGRAEAIINDYLNFAKPQFEKIVKIQLAEVIREVQFLLDALAVKEGIILESVLEEDTYIHTDRNQLKQALVNIVKNAIEATPKGGKVSIQLIKKADQSVITVTDTGKGMDSEQLSRIGILFYSTKDKGTGLGTSVSLKIIETMNGKLSYSSEIGKGTVVEIILPL
jgi:two-component system sporulation sensor kinase B